MNLNFETLRLLKGTKGKTKQARKERDMLVIDCTGCEYRPEPSSVECLRCMVDMMAVTGCAERIILRNGNDTEISGKSAEIIADIASLKRWSIPNNKPSGTCKRCSLSRERIMQSLWSSFPDLHLADFQDQLERVPTRGRCVDCVRTTSRMVRTIEVEMSRLKE